jgi:two-component system nitrate/nitrite response regulator NarL
MRRDGRSAIRVAVLHANRLLRESLAQALARQDNVTIAGIGSDPAALSDERERQPDVVIVDLAAPSRVGLTHAREITSRWPETAVLMLGVRELESDLMDCCEAGAAACLFEEASWNDLIAQIRAVAAGEALCAPRVAGFLFSQLRESARQLRRLRELDVPHLTRRELEILALIDEQLTNKEIAVRLNIEVQTVKNHVHNILQNLELESRRDAVRYAKERGLLPPQPDVRPPGPAADLTKGMRPVPVS